VNESRCMFKFLSNARTNLQKLFKATQLDHLGICSPEDLSIRPSLIHNKNMNNQLKHHYMEQWGRREFSSNK
jgi:hypothetical protein